MLIFVYAAYISLFYFSCGCKCSDYSQLSSSCLQMHCSQVLCDLYKHEKWNYSVSTLPWIFIGYQYSYLCFSFPWFWFRSDCQWRLIKYKKFVVRLYYSCVVVKISPQEKLLPRKITDQKEASAIILFCTCLSFHSAFNLGIRWLFTQIC